MHEVFKASLRDGERRDDFIWIEAVPDDMKFFAVAWIASAPQFAGRVCVGDNRVGLIKQE